MRNQCLEKVAKTVLSGSNNDTGTTSHIINEIFPESNIIKLSNSLIKPCLGCEACINGYCIMEDDFNNIIREISPSFILVSPVYFLGFPSFVKAFIDRFQKFWYSDIKYKFDYSAIILHGERGNYKSEQGLKFLSEIIFKLLKCEKTFFTILHKFNLKNRKDVENKIIWVKEQLKTAFFAK